MFSGSTLQRLSQVGAWLLALAIAALSLGPPSTRTVTGVGHNLEHLLMFLVTGGAFTIGYSHRLSHLLFALPAFAAAIELAQMLVPGRHARLSDFLVDAAALYLGLGVSYLVVRLTAATGQR